jgi:DNA-binding MarR family transcriptional regulator
VSRQSELREIDRSLYRITRIARGRMAARMRSERSGVELSRAGATILSALVSRGGLRLGELAELTDTEPAIVTREMRVLTAQRYVAVGPDPTDGRARIVTVTPEGKVAYQRYRDAIDEIIADSFASWTSTDLITLRRLLARVAEDFAHPGRAPRPPGASRPPGAKPVAKPSKQPGN